MKPNFSRALMDYVMRNPPNTILVIDYITNSMSRSWYKRFSAYGFVFYPIDAEANQTEYTTQQTGVMTVRWVANYATKEQQLAREQAAGTTPWLARGWVGVSFDPAGVSCQLPPVSPQKQAEPKVAVTFWMPVSVFDAFRSKIMLPAENRAQAVLRVVTAAIGAAEVTR